MRVISPNFSGLVIHCEKCHALLQYDVEDVYGKVIYCPLCKGSTEVPLQKEVESPQQEKQ